MKITIESVKNKTIALDYAAIILIGLLSFGYCLHANHFAKYGIRLPFLPFPVFIGEIVLFTCAVLFLSKWLIIRWKPGLPYIAAAVYIMFVLAKAFYGCYKWGPLAFRHAATFYYPAFAFFGYFFYRRDFFSKKMAMLLILVFAAALLNNSYPYDLLTCFVLIIVLCRELHSRLLKYVVLPLFLLAVSYKLFFQGTRTLLVSNAVFIIFLLIAIPFMLNIGKRPKTVLRVSLVCMLLLGVFKIADSNALKSIIDFKQTASLYDDWNKVIASEEETFKMAKASQVKIYNTDSDNGWSPSVNIPPYVLKSGHTMSYTPIQRKYGNLMDLESAVGNSIFRVFIWRDMLEAIITVKPLLGFDFGMPFRSKKIEILNLAYGEWSRDGWIGAHNSYLETIYRAGLVGCAVIFVLFITLFSSIKQAIDLKLINGILLCSVLINWLTAANFMLVFELPHNAIPFWALFGMTLAYLFKDRVRNNEEKTDRK